MVLSASGDILGSLEVGSVTLTAGDAIGAEILADDSAALEAGADISGFAIAGGSVTMEAAGDIVSDFIDAGSVELIVTGDIETEVSATGGITVEADGGIDSTIATTGPVTLIAAGDISGSVAGGDVLIGSTAGRAGTSSTSSLRVDADTLTVSTYGDTYIQSHNGRDLNLKRVESLTGDIHLSTNAAIKDTDQDSAADVIGSLVVLTGIAGIGLADTLEIDSEVAQLVSFTAIHVHDVTGDLVLRQATTIPIMGDNRLVLGAQGSIRTESDSVRLEAAEEIVLNAGESIDVDIRPTAGLSATAGADIEVDQVSGDLNLLLVETAGGDVTLTAEGSIVDVGDDAAADVVGNDIHLIATNGSIGASDVDIDSNGLVTLAANGRIEVEEVVGDLQIDQAWSATSDVHLIASDGNIILGEIAAPGMVELIARDAIERVSDEPALHAVDEIVNIAANVVDLTAQTGAIGQEASPLLVELLKNPTDPSFTASAAEGVFVDLVLVERLATLPGGIYVIDGAVIDDVRAGGDVQLRTRGRVEDDESSVFVGSVFHVNGDIDTPAFVSLLGDAESSFNFGGGGVRSGEQGSAVVATVYIDAAGNVTAGNIDAVDGGGVVTVSGAISDLGNTGSTGGIEITGNVVNPVSGLGQVVVVNASGELLIVNESDKDVVLGDIDLGAPVSNGNGTIVLNGIEQTPTALNGVTFEATGSGGTGDIRVTSNGNSDVRIAGEVLNRDGTTQIDVSGGSILGDTADHLLAAYDLSLNADGTLGDSGQVLRIDVEGGRLTASADSDIYVADVAGHLGIDQISSSANTTVTTAGHMFDANGDDQVNVVGSLVSLRSLANGIGDQGDALDIDSQLTRLLADGDIFVTETSGDMNLDLAQASNGSVRLGAAGSIVDANADSAANVIGATADLHASGGSLGSATNPLETAVDGEVGGSALQDAFVDGVGGGLRVASLSVENGSVVLTAADGDIEVAGVTAGNDITIDSPGVIVGAGDETEADLTAEEIYLSAATTIGDKINALSLESRGLVTANAGSALYLREVAGDLNVGTLTVTDGKAEVAAGGSILDGEGDDAVDVEADTILLVAGGDIGAELDSLEIDTKTSIDALAGGSIYLKDSDDDFLVGRIEAQGAAVLVATESFVDALASDAANVAAVDVDLTALDGRIGRRSEWFTIDADNDLSMSAEDIYAVELGGNSGGGDLEATRRVLALAVEGGDLNLDTLQARTVEIELDQGDANVEWATAQRFATLVEREGGALVIDDFELAGKRSQRLQLLADHVTVGISDERERARDVRFDIRGNDGLIAERIEVTGAGGKNTRFDKLYARSALIDIDSVLERRGEPIGNRVLMRKLILIDGGMIRNSSLEATVAPGDEASFSVYLYDGLYQIRPRDFDRDITVEVLP